MDFAEDTDEKVLKSFVGFEGVRATGMELANVYVNLGLL